MGRQGSRESYGHVCCRSICRPILRARGCRLDLLGFDYLREEAACVIFVRVFANSCIGRGLSRCGGVHDARDIYVRPSSPRTTLHRSNLTSSHSALSFSPPKRTNFDSLPRTIDTMHPWKQIRYPWDNVWNQLCLNRSSYSFWNQ